MSVQRSGIIVGGIALGALAVTAHLSLRAVRADSVAPLEIEAVRPGPREAWVGVSPDTAMSGTRSPVEADHTDAVAVGTVHGPEVQAASTPSWDEIQSEFVGRMYLSEKDLQSILQDTIDSPIAPDREWLEKRYGPASSPAALAVTEAAIIEHNLRIEFEARGYLDDLSRTVRDVVNRGAFSKSAGAVPPTEAAKPALLVQSLSYHGWNSILTLGRIDHPELDAKQKEIVHMAYVRDQECNRLIRGE